MQVKERKEFVLNTLLYDDTDKNARTSESEILKARNIKIGKLNLELPRRLYKRNDHGEILGIRLKAASTIQAAASIMQFFDSTKDAKTSDIHIKGCALQTIQEEISDDITEEIASELGQTVEFVESLKRKGRPKKPIDRNETIIKQYEALLQLKQDINHYVDSLEELLPKIPETPGKPKHKFTDGFKRDLFQKHFGNATEILCPCCKLRKIYLDCYDASHIIPESRGGACDMTNILPTCKECNVRTATRHLYWYAWKTYGVILFQCN